MSDGAPRRGEVPRNPSRGAVVSITDRYLDWTRVRGEEGEFWVPDEALFALR
jgi:hypothetical protein